MKPTIVRRIRRAEPDAIRTLGELGVATVHEAQGRSGLMRPYMRPIYPTARISGSAITISSQPGDNLMIHATLELCEAGDVLVVTTTSDSTDSTIGDGSASGSPRVYRRARITRQRNSETKHLGNGKVTLVVGYQHSTSYRFDAPHFPEMVPLGGIFVASLLGPYPLPLASRRLAWYAGVAGTVSRLSRIAIRADTIAAELTTERTLAPEAMLMLMYRVAPSYRVFLGASYQYLRFGSLTYRAVQPEDRIPATILATLPESLELRSVHHADGHGQLFASHFFQATFGRQETASGLIPGR